MDFPPFPGFRPEAFAFLSDLKEHNDREWFKPRKATFDDELKWPLQCLIADTSRQARERGLPLQGDPKKSAFRIYRDTRFSKNKAPYKTHVSGVLSRSGSKKEPGGLYVHIEPGNVFAGAGFWAPETPLLRQWRTRMTDDPEAFLHMVEMLEGHGLTMSHRDTLKRMPRGFEAAADTPIADYLKWKSFFVMKEFGDAAPQSPAFTEQVVDIIEQSLPLLTFGWEIMDDAPIAG
ncbi:MAG: DUF2461 domain-containing protein [Rhodothermales bacterium]